MYSYRKATGKTLPRTSYAQIASLDHVRKRDRKVGDVVFFRGGGHVGIYLGKNRIVHALNPGAGCASTARPPVGPAARSPATAA